MLHRLLLLAVAVLMPMVVPKPAAWAEMPAVHHSASALRLVMMDNAPLFSIRKPNGDLHGFNIELARDICDTIQTPCRMELRPFDQIIERVAAGEYDMGFANLLKSPARESRVLYSAAYWRSSTSFVGRNGLAGVWPTDDNLADIARQWRVVAVHDSHQHQALLRLAGADAKVVTAESISQVWRILRDGGAELAMVPTLNALGFLTSDVGQGFDTVGVPLSGEGLGGTIHIIFPPGREDLKTEVDAAIIKLRTSGVYQDINRRYFPFDVY